MILGSTLVFGVISIGLGLSTNLWVFFAFMFLLGLSVPAFSTPSFTVLQETVEPEMQGRVFGFVGIVMALSMPFGMAVFGPLADTFSVESLLDLGRGRAAARRGARAGGARRPTRDARRERARDGLTDVRRDGRRPRRRTPPRTQPANVSSRSASVRIRKWLTCRPREVRRRPEDPRVPVQRTHRVEVAVDALARRAGAGEAPPRTLEGDRRLRHGVGHRSHGLDQRGERPPQRDVRRVGVAQVVVDGPDAVVHAPIAAPG